MVTFDRSSHIAVWNDEHAVPDDEVDILFGVTCIVFEQVSVTVRYSRSVPRLAVLVQNSFFLIVFVGIRHRFQTKQDAVDGKHFATTVGIGVTQRGAGAESRIRAVKKAVDHLAGMVVIALDGVVARSEEHTSELQSH